MGNGRGKKILDIGVESSFRELRHRLLTKAGFAVTSVESAKQALEAIKRTQYAVLVVGAWVTKEDRNRVVRAVKDRNPNAKVIFYYDQNITGTEEADAILNYRGDHADLVRTVQHLLARANRQDRDGDGDKPKRQLAAVIASVATALSGLLADLPTLGLIPA